MKTTFKLLALATILSASTTSMAEGAKAVSGVTGKVDVKLNVSTGCIVEGAEADGALNNFGTLDFGKTASDWKTALSTELVAPNNGGKIAVKCDGEEAVPFNVTVNSGVNGGVSGKRLLKHTEESATIEYEIYQDSARSKTYTKDEKVAFTTASGQSTVVPIFASIPAGQGAKIQGDYTDTLLVNITF